MISKKDLMQNRNSYNRDINKRIFLQEDIERLEERVAALQDMKCGLEEELKGLYSEKNKLMKQQLIGSEENKEALNDYKGLVIEYLRTLQNDVKEYEDILPDFPLNMSIESEFGFTMKLSMHIVNTGRLVHLGEDSHIKCGDLCGKASEIRRFIKNYPKLYIDTESFLLGKTLDKQHIL